MALNEEHILSKSENITVGDVLKKGRIHYCSSYAGAEIILSVNAAGTAIVRTVIDHETCGEPNVTVKEVYQL